MKQRREHVRRRKLKRGGKFIFKKIINSTFFISQPYPTKMAWRRNFLLIVIIFPIISRHFRLNYICLVFFFVIFYYILPAGKWAADGKVDSVDIYICYDGGKKKKWSEKLSASHVINRVSSWLLLLLLLVSEWVSE